MGKQSKKKKGLSKKDKAAHKAKVQDRKERAHESAIAQANPTSKTGNNYIDAFTLIPGDRVWFFDDYTRDENDPHSYRGILRSISDGGRDGNVNGICEVQPLSNYFSEDPTTTLRILESDVYRDIDPLTTRYKVGEELVCNTCYGYLPATITHLWPIWEEYRNDIPDHMPCYKLMCYPSKAGLNKNPFAIAAPFDDDSVTSKRPLEFRFVVGDKVVFDARRANKAKLVSRRPPSHAQGWIGGEVVEVDVLGLEDIYAVYKCAAIKADERVREMYYISKDDDEHIGTAEKSKVRDRFLESIEQGCSFRHLEFLAENFGMDLSPVRDMVLERALEYGSFDALRWLEGRMEVDLKSLRFADGNHILHQMAASPHAVRFFSGFSAYSASESPKNSLCNRYNRDGLDPFVGKNGSNQEFLQVLLDSGNVRAIEVVLSLRGHLFWSINAQRRYPDLEKLKISGKNDIAALLLNEFWEHSTLDDQSNSLQLFFEKSETDVMQEPCITSLVNTKDGATKYIRFMRQWEDHHGMDAFKSIDSTITRLARAGFIEIFKLFFNADKSIADFRSQQVFFDPGVTHNEFLQPEQIDEYEQDDQERIFNIVPVVTGGTVPLRPYCENYELRYYLTLLTYLAVEKLENGLMSFDSLVEYFKMKFRSTAKDDRRESLYRYQLDLLQDDITVSGRIRILSLLVREEGWVPPNILDPIRMRECKIFIWVFRNSLKKLDNFAFCDKDLTSPLARKLEFLGGRRVSKTCSLGTFLLFACVELDSLHILAWLVEKERVAINDSVNGFHLIHSCAYFGRIEIVVWLCTRPEWDEILRDLATRQGFERKNAAHIAVKRGHTILASLLLELGCSEVDGNGKTVDVTAASSSHEYVRKWGEENSPKEGPMRLGKCIEKLFQILQTRDYEAAKIHITTSQCLKIEQWEHADLCVNDPLPNGATYRDTILRCVKANVDENFALWLCYELVSFRGIRGISHNYRLLEDLNRFWNKPKFHMREDLKRLDNIQLQGMIRSYNLKELSQWLSKPWAKDISVLDPEDVNPIIWNNCLDEQRAKKLKLGHLRINVYHGLLDRLDKHSKQQIAQGASSEIIVELYWSYRTIAERLAKTQNKDLADLFNGIFTNDRNEFINMDHELYMVKYDRTHDSTNHLPFTFKTNFEKRQIHRVLAIENYDHLIKLSHRNGKGWNASMELEVIRISSFFSHTAIVDYFLSSQENIAFRASLEQRCRAVMLGAAETGKIDDWVQLMRKSGRIDDPLAISFSDTKQIEEDQPREDYETTRELKIDTIIASPAAMCVYGYIIIVSGCKANQFCSLDNYKAILKNLNESGSYDATIFLRSALYIIDTFHDLSFWESMIIFADLLHSSYDLDPFRSDTRKLVDEITKFAQQFLACSIEKDKERMEHVVFQWLTMIANWGVNIQNVRCYDGLGRQSDVYKRMNEEIQNIKTMQRDKWTELNIMKQDLKLDEIQEAVKNGSLNLDATDKGGLHPAHLAAAYNRVDILEWLVESENVDFEQIDFASRNVLNVARASKANQAVTWLEERHAKSVIATFVRKYFMKCLAQRRTARLLAGVKRLQAQHRGMMARKKHRGILLSVVEEAQRFQAVWTGTVALLSDTSIKPYCWSSFRDLQQSRVSDKADIEGLLESEEILGAAMELALEDKEEMDCLDDSGNDEAPKNLGEVQGAIQQNQTNECGISTKTMIHLSSEVVKWLRQADAKYREFFVRRIQQLQNGDRSRILAKRLRGSQSTIFETYLEQKSGHRILWQTETDKSILIWYVAKHKHVSRLMRLIDDSESRSARQRVEASSMPELDMRSNDHNDNSEAASRVVLNPQGNVPLKVYEVKPDSITDVLDASWSPQLYLSDEERSIVEGSGTILLLGRSGTGKTVCICNRMDLDRQQHQNNNSFSQLFVARSQRLARYVTETVGRHDRCVFTTFGELLLTLETELPDSDSVRSMFLPSQKMNFSRFKKDLYGGTMGRNNKQYIDPMIAWTNIRTFVKGSIEALSNADQTVDKEGFLQLGKKRCRLDQTDRQKVYNIFERYQKVLAEQNLWDDNDRISALLQRLTLVLDSDHESFERVRRSKIYVDEIQDYTQSEILLFFRLCGPGNLFLAGDPAQSVVEGVEFRFEEIRSVGYFVAGPERRDLIPDKPKKVTVNFRSHSGILNTAAAILRRLFDTFPDSAKELGEDRGVFTGPRPGVFHGVPIEQLQRLVTEKLNGIVILTHDESVPYWKRALGGYPLIHGIRGAKGLEFKRVMVLGFFNETQRDLQKPWRDLLLGREVAKQELESKLKLLYTAVTRCIEQLFFAETVRSVAGDAFVRWATTTSVRSDILATRQKIDNIETMAMTQDEWIASGLDNAEVAESHAGTEIEESLSMFEKALFCFEQGKEEDLARKVRSHKASLLFRLDLQEGKIVWSENGPENTEFSSALLAEQLVSENLLLEARRLLSLSILPHMGSYTKEQVKKNIISKLPSDNSVYS